ncbi:hypothetical protein Tco_1276428 [Tanacetum coccineum]
MKFCLRSLQLFVHSVLAIPSRFRGNTCTRVDSWALNMLAISSKLLMCSTTLSVGPPEKEILRNSLRSYPLISNVGLSRQVNLLLVLFWSRAKYCSKVDRLECAYAVYPILPAISNQSRIIWEVGGILRRLKAFVASPIGCGGSDDGIA